MEGEMNKFKGFFVVIFAIWGMASNASPIDALSLLYVKMTLDDLGYDVGARDGRMGPKTRGALQAYAKERGTDDDASSVMGDMIERSYQARIPLVISEEEREQIQRVVSERLLDPQSATIHEEMYLLDGSICGKVNGKNVYGGYVGFRYFRVHRGMKMPTRETRLPPGFLGLDNEQYRSTWYFCNMTGFR
jgi:hypothetical protein